MLARLHREKNRWLWSGGAASVVLTAALVGGSWGIAYGQTTPAPAAAPPTTAAGVATALTGTAPSSISTALSANSGGTIIAGNVGLSIAAGSLIGANGDVTVNVTANPVSVANINAGGPSTFSPNGTTLDVDIRDSVGKRITSFSQALTIVTKPGPADLAMARAKLGLAQRVFADTTAVQSPINLLTLAYVVDADTPAPANPNRYPVNTLVLVPPSVVTVDAVNGVVSANLNFLGSVVAVVTNPVGYVQTLAPNAAEYSSFDPTTSQTFAAKPQFTFLQVVEPQIGGRLQVIDPDTNNFAFVNASDVAPSGAPPPKTSAAVVRGLR